jgi:hypothetical protein
MSGSQFSTGEFMAFKCSGAEWKAFCKTRPEGWDYKGAYFSVDGARAVERLEVARTRDDSVVLITGGCVCCNPGGHRGSLLEAVVRNWRTNTVKRADYEKEKNKKIQL